MFGLGLGEIVVVILIALIFLGPEKIPETASSLGKWFHELKRSMDDVKNAFEKDFKENPVQKKASTLLDQIIAPPEKPSTDVKREEKSLKD